MRIVQRLLPFSLAGALFTAGCSTTGAQGPQPVNPTSDTRPAAFANRHLPQPTHLSEDVRAAIKKTMNAHGDDFTMLLWSILFLDLDAASETAKGIVTRPTVTAKPEEKVRLPPQLLVLSSQLNEQATHMAELSKQPERDSEAFAKSFGELAQTCVRCHAVYLYEKGTEPAKTE